MLPAKVKGILDANLTGIGIAEKGYADFKITVKAKGGHSSQPPKHTALGVLSKRLKRLKIISLRREFCRLYIIFLHR